MKRTLCLFLLGITLIPVSLVRAQPFAYSFSTFTQPYVPLSGEQAFLNKTWRGDTSNFVVASPFSFSLDTLSGTFFYFIGANTCSSDPGKNILSGFNATEATLIDRGVVGGTPLSPVRARITGTPGNRILKAEVYNAGFAAEYDSLHTTGDSACVQIWLYETDNSIEIHYGPSRVTHPSLYFAYGGGPLVCYVQDNVLYPTQNGPVYVLAGPAAAPGVQPNVIQNGQIQNFVIPLRSWPADGTVYRFFPDPQSVAALKQTGITIYPTYAHDEITVKGSHASFRIISANGAAMGISGTLKGSDTRVDISALSQGMYLFVTERNGIKSVQKFVKM